MLQMNVPVRRRVIPPKTSGQSMDLSPVWMFSHRNLAKSDHGQQLSTNVLVGGQGQVNKHMTASDRTSCPDYYTWKIISSPVLFVRSHAPPQQLLYNVLPNLPDEGVVVNRAHQVTRGHTCMDRRSRNIKGRMGTDPHLADFDVATSTRHAFAMIDMGAIAGEVSIHEQRCSVLQHRDESAAGLWHSSAVVSSCSLTLLAGWFCWVCHGQRLEAAVLLHPHEIHSFSGHRATKT